MAEPRSVRIVGAGVSGLTAAYYLERAGWDVTVFERASAAGGMIATIPLQRARVETAANAVLNNERFESLARAIGLELVGTQRAARKRYIFRERPRRWPLGLRESARALGGAFRGLVTRQIFRPLPGESVAAWSSRNFGQALSRHLLAPALQGVYAERAEDLSAALIVNSLRAGGRERGRPELRGSVAPKGGMGELAVRLREYLEARGVRFEFARAVTAADLRATGPWILATSLAGAADLLAPDHPEAGHALGRLPRVPLVSASVVYPKAAIRFPGFGCLFPRDAGFRALGMLSNTHIFPGRTSEHCETWIYSAAAGDSLLSESDAEILARLGRDRARLTLEAREPLEWRITRWPEGIPSYGSALESFLASGQVEKLAAQGIHLHGNYLGRLGLAGIIASSAGFPERLAREAK